MNQEIILEGAKLYKIAHASHSAEVTNISLALRTRLRGYSDIGRIKQALIRAGEKIVDADYMAYWKGMQDIDAGSIIYGRRGRPDKFQWHYSLKKIAKAAMDGSDEKAERVVQAKASLKAKVKLKPKTKVVAKEIVKNEPKEVKAAQTPTVHPSYTFMFIPLRKDFNLKFEIPFDISKQEVATITDALNRLSA